MLNKIRNESKPEGSKIKTVLEEFTFYGDVQLTEGFKKNLRDLLTHATWFLDKMLLLREESLSREEFKREII